MTVPAFPSSRIERAQFDRNFPGWAKRCEDAQTLGMFRLQDNKFLLVYNGQSRLTLRFEPKRVNVDGFFDLFSEFAFHVARHG